MTAGPGYTFEALLEILERALRAVAQHGCYQGRSDPTADCQPVAAGWDEAFVRLSHRDQARWLVELFQALTDSEVAWLSECLHPGMSDAGAD